MPDNKPSTFIEQAIQSATEEAQGRWAKSAPQFPGANVYPRQGDDSPWSQGGAVPPEGPFPGDINFVPAVGEFHERERLASPSSPISEGGASPRSVEPDAASFHREPVPGGSTPEDIPDGCPGPRRPDGTPLSSPPMGLRRRA
jgi:hypothetical protein